MGKVICVTHRPQQSPLCCNHVLEAIDDSCQTKTSVEPHGLVYLSLDLLDDDQKAN